MNLRALGLGVAAAVVVLDQVAKEAASRALEGADIAALPFLDLVLARNTGISFSLFAHGSEAARWALLAFTGAATLAVLAWLWRSRSRVAAFGLGLVLGGAVGNGLDRIVRGSVIDFLDLHFGAWHLFVFNLADAAISLGVAVLLWDGLFGAGASASARGNAA